MTEGNTKTDTDEIVVTEEISIDSTEVDQGMNKIMGESILEALQDLIKILEDRIVENTEVVIGMKTTVQKEVRVDLGKGHFQKITILVLPSGCIEYYVIAMLHSWAQSIPYYHILP